MMVFELIKSRLSKKESMRKAFNTSKVHPLIAALPFKMRFEHSRLYISAFMPFVIGFVGGVLASVLGIGGGFIFGAGDDLYPRDANDFGSGDIASSDDLHNGLCNDSCMRH